MELRTLLGEWQQAIVSPSGPESPTTRLVLSALSVHMARDLTASVTVELLAIRTALTERSVQNHIKLAIKSGWLSAHRETRDGRAWFYTKYRGEWPDNMKKPARPRRKLPKEGDEMKFKTSGPVMIASSETGDWDGFVVPDTNAQLLVVTKDGHYWHFFAAASGVELQVWDERPEGFATDYPYPVQDIHRALEMGKEIYDAAAAAGVPLYSADDAEMKAALARVDFIIIDDHNPVLCRRYAEPKPERKVTQKLLDGGQDMTIKVN